MKQHELQIPASIENLNQVNAFVEAALDEADCPPKATMQMMIAVQELYVNIAQYAYAPASGDAVIRTIYSEADGTFSIIFIDSGMPFDPLAQENPDITLSAEVRPVGGLGIYMVKKSMDSFTYARCDEKNMVTITKKW